MALDGAAAPRHRRPRRRHPRRRPQVWEASGHLANFTDPLVDCRNCKERLPPRQARGPGHLPELRQAAAPSPRPASSTSCSRPTPGPVEGAGAEVYLRPETAQGMFVDFKSVLETTPQEAAVRHRPGRQELPQRDHARQLRLPHPRVRADGDGVLRAARRRAAVVRVLVRRADGLVRRPRHARRPAAAPGPRRRRAEPLLARAPPTWSSSSRGAGTSSRASPTAATTTSPSTPSTRARSSSTSTRPPASATCPT